MFFINNKHVLNLNEGIWEFLFKSHYRPTCYVCMHVYRLCAIYIILSIVQWIPTIRKEAERRQKRSDWSIAKSNVKPEHKTGHDRR